MTDITAWLKALAKQQRRCAVINGKFQHLTNNIYCHHPDIMVMLIGNCNNNNNNNNIITIISSV